MKDMKLCKMYKLVVDGYDLVYIGHTIVPLSKRRQGHKDKRSKCHSRALFELGPPVKIILIEYYPCNNEEEARKREQELIEEYGDRCVNCNRAYRSDEYIKQYTKNNSLKYVAENKDKIKEQRANHYAENSDRLKEQKIKYYAENKDIIKEKRDKYVVENKDKIKEQKIKYYAENKDIIKEKRDKYVVENKGKIKEQRAKHYAENSDRLKEQKKKYYAENKELLNKRQRERRAEKKQEAENNQL